MKQRHSLKRTRLSDQRTSACIENYKHGLILLQDCGQSPKWYQGRAASRSKASFCKRNAIAPWRFEGAA